MKNMMMKALTPLLFPIGKPFPGGFNVQIRLQRHFYTAGLAVYITLARKLDDHANSKAAADPVHGHVAGSNDD